MYKITVAVISNRQIKAKTTQSLLEMIARGKYDFHFVVAEHGYTIAENRTYCAVKAANNNSDFLFFVDDDMVFPLETLDILVEQDKDVIGPAYKSRKADAKRTAAILEGGFIDLDTVEEDKYQKTFECKAKGTGVLLIKVGVFEKMDRPWFDFVYDKDLGVCTMGEDYFFCKKAREQGFKIWCDPTIKIGHLGDFTY